MTLWCENCEMFTGKDLEQCEGCGTDLVPPEQAGVVPCGLCGTYEVMEQADICPECFTEVKECEREDGFAVCLDAYPELCMECLKRFPNEKFGMCDPCYTEICWGVPSEDSYESAGLKSYYPSDGKFDNGGRTPGYSFWDEEPDLPIPDVAVELEIIPAMRVAA